MTCPNSIAFNEPSERKGLLLDALYMPLGALREIHALYATRDKKVVVCSCDQCLAYISDIALMLEAVGAFAYGKKWRDN